MVDFSILARFNSTNERLREIFTAEAPPTKTTIPKNETKEGKALRLKQERKLKQDIGYRQQMEREIRVRVDEGVVQSLKNYQLYAAADLAWDSSPVNKFTMPLIMYAQGKVSVQTAATSLQGMKGGSDYIKKDDKGQPISVDLPKFFECNINLVRSFVTRRVAAQSNIFSNLYPFYKYEPRTTGLVGKCRADVLSQRMDIMTDDYAYREHDEQCYRDAFLYGHCVDFPRASWEVEKQWVLKEVDDGMENKTAPEDNSDLEAQVVKEGVSFINPHPSRVFWDNNSPLSSINTDTGCEFIGFWDIVRFRDVMNNTSYFNTEKIGWSTRFWGMGGIYLNYKAYFDQFATTIIPPPGFTQGATLDPAGENDRKTNIGVYSVDQQDASLLQANYFRKLIPKEYGIGDYPFPVWVRFIVASDATVCYAEFMPSTPGAYLGINENDSKQVNISVAHELMSYQDQLSNLFTDMLMIVQGELFKAIGINTDCLEKTQVDAIRAHFKGTNWSASPLVFEFSLKKMEELKFDPSNVVTVTETRIGQSLTAIFEAMAKLISMAEKLMAMSPAEQGQPAPREISATEVNEIASTTTSVYSFISTAINRFRSAKKRMLYESLLCCGEAQIKCPVMDRYPDKVIKDAGFESLENEKEGFVSSIGVNRHTVIGSKRKLIHDYIFTSRDGNERAVNSQAANTLVQLVGQILNVPAVLAATGKEKLYEIFNEIFRLSGAGIDLNLQLKPGEDNAIGPDQVKQFQQVVQQMQQAMQQLATAVQSDTTFIQQQKQVNDSVQKHFDVLAPIAKEVQKLVAGNAKESISLDYRDVPEDIKRQMERAAGFQPSTMTAPVETQ